MNTTLQNVVEFHKAFGQLVSEKITYDIPDNVKKLRWTLITEEYKELVKAEEEDDRIEIADALCDLRYVVNGTIIAHGLHYIWDELSVLYRQLLIPLPAINFRIDDYLFNNNDSIVVVLLKIDAFIDLKIDFHGMTELFSKMFDEVHASNMSKVCQTIEEAEETVAKYASENIEVNYEMVGDTYVIMRKNDRKALKSINFRKPNLAQFLDM